MAKPFMLVLAAVVSLHAQVTVLNRFPARSSEIEVLNDSDQTMTAFVVSMAPVPGSDPNTRPFVRFVDTLVDTDPTWALFQMGMMPLLPNERYAVPVPDILRVGRRVDLYEPPIAVAAVFADGTTRGDAVLVSSLLSRRGSLLQAIDLAREMLSNAGMYNVPRNQLIQQFRLLADSVSHWYLPPHEQVGRALYESIAEQLTSLPPQQVGSAFPPAHFVEAEITILNRRRLELSESQPSLAMLWALQVRH